jgi:hypothetical protein
VPGEAILTGLPAGLYNELDTAWRCLLRYSGVDSMIAFPFRMVLACSLFSALLLIPDTRCFAQEAAEDGMSVTVPNPVTEADSF